MMRRVKRTRIEVAQKTVLLTPPPAAAARPPRRRCLQEQLATVICGGDRDAVDGFMKYIGMAGLGAGSGRCGIAEGGGEGGGRRKRRTRTGRARLI